MVKLNVHTVEIIVHEAQDNTINVLRKLNVHGWEKSVDEFDKNVHDFKMSNF